MKSAVLIPALITIVFVTSVKLVSSTCPTCICKNISMQCDSPICSNLTKNSVYWEFHLNVTGFNIHTICYGVLNSLTCKECLKTIYLDDNKISVIHPDAFRGLGELSYLYLDRNNISELHYTIFRDSIKLQRLDLSINRIRFLHPDMFVKNTQLYHLNLSNNMLVLNGTMLNAQNLNILDVSYCNPSRDKSWNTLNENSFRGLPNLTKLILEGNNIQSLRADTFIHTPRLLELNLRDNLLTVVQIDFHHCPHLKFLYISKNHLICDCDMKKFSTWCSNHDIRLGDVSCGNPTASWALLDTLDCNNAVTSFTTTSLTSKHVTISEAYTETLSISFRSTVTSKSTSSIISTTQPSQEDILSNITLSNVRRILNFTNQTIHTPPSTSSDIKSSIAWYAFGICISVLIAIVSVILLVRFARKVNSMASAPATHYFNFKGFKPEVRTYDEVNENRKDLQYIKLENLHKVTGQRMELHYSSCDVTNILDEPTLSSRVRTVSSNSGILETNIDTLSTNVIFHEHIYEEMH